MVQRGGRIKGPCRLMEGGRATRRLPRGASCGRGREAASPTADRRICFSCSECRRAHFRRRERRMIWMSPARVMFPTHEGHPPELIIVIQHAASVLRSLCRGAAGCADVRHDKSVSGLTNSCCSPNLGYNKEVPFFFLFLGDHIGRRQMIMAPDADISLCVVLI